MTLIRLYKHPVGMTNLILLLVIQIKCGGPTLKKEIIITTRYWKEFIYLYVRRERAMRDPMCGGPSLFNEQ